MLDAQPSTMDHSRRKWLLRACWGATIVLWTLAADMALELIGDPIPAHYNLILFVAASLTAVSLLAPIALANRDVANARLDQVAAEVESLRQQVIQRDEAWHAVNTLLGSERPYLRDVSRTGPN